MNVILKTRFRVKDSSQGACRRDWFLGCLKISKLSFTFSHIRRFVKDDDARLSRI